MGAHNHDNNHKEFKKHKINLRVKRERIDGLKALILTHELTKGKFDRDYVKKLRGRLKMAEHQYANMRP